MASTVSVFRDNAIEKDRLEKQNEADRTLSEHERVDRRNKRPRTPPTRSIPFAMAWRLSRMATSLTAS
jgi:hypothetical protein